MNTLATKKAPPVTLPIRYIVTGIVSYFIAQLAMLLWPDKLLTGPVLRPETISLVHLLTLGWASMVVIGVLYQMIPVLLQVDLHREDVGRFLFWPALIGVSTLIVGFRIWNTTVIATGGTITTLSFFAYGWNMRGTLLNVKAWSRQGFAMLAGLVFFMLTVLWGFMMTLTLRFGFLGSSLGGLLGSHIAMGFIGWFTLMIFGVAYRLVPMFALSHGFTESRQLPAILLLGGGTFLFIARAFWPGIPGWTGATLVMVAFLLFALDVRTIFKHRRRRKLELVSRFSAASVVAGITVFALIWGRFLAGQGSWLDDERVLIAAGYMALLGWISLMIVGHLYKIIPFLAWLHRYGDKAGKEAVPLLRELFNRKVSEACFWLLVIGTGMVFIGILAGLGLLTRLSLLATLAGTLAFAYNVWEMVQPKEAKN